MPSLSDLDRIEQAIHERLLDGDDAPQVAKDTGASVAMVQSVLLLPNVKLMGE